MGHILGKCVGAFDVEALVGEICEAIPGTKVTNMEESSDRIARQGEITKQLGTLTSSHPVDGAGDAARRRGMRCEVEIPLGESLWLKGTISRTGVVLATDGDFTQDDVRPVLEVLGRCPGLKVITSATS
jgi:hypothetical protein